MKKLLWLCLFSPFLTFAQVSPRLVCSNIKVYADSLKFESTDSRIVGYLEGEGLQVMKFFFNNEITIDAVFKIQPIQSRRSSVKSGSIRVSVVYFLVAGNSVDKRKTERIIYLNDLVDFDFLENFVYQDGLKNKRVSLSYKLTKQ